MNGQNFLNSLKMAQQLAAQNDANIQREHMGKVFSANPAFATSYYGAQNQVAQQQLEQQKMAMLQQEQEQKNMQRTALAQMAGELGQGVTDPTAASLAKIAAITGDPSDFVNYQIQLEKAKSPESGGATGVLIDRLMKENPNMTFGDALAQVQTGYRSGVNFEGGRAIPIQGLGSALGRIGGEKSYGTEMGTLNAQLELKPQLEAATSEQSAIGKAAGERSADVEKKAATSGNMLDLVREARKELPNATSGMLGRGATATAKFFGTSTDASKSDAKLKVISAALTGNVPRFEGPQGVLDVELYKQAAGDVANADLPYEDRLAALDSIENLQKKYANASKTKPSANKKRYNPTTGNFE